MKAVLILLQAIIFLVSVGGFVSNASRALDAASHARAGALSIRSQMVSESFQQPVGYQVWR